MTDTRLIQVPAEELELLGRYLRQVRHGGTFDEIYEAMYHANQLRRKWQGKKTYSTERALDAPIPGGF